jgi:hypothetical protein
LAAVFEGFNDRLGDALPRDPAGIERFRRLRHVLEVQMYAWNDAPDDYEAYGPDVVTWPFDPEDESGGVEEAAPAGLEAADSSADSSAS